MKLRLGFLASHGGSNLQAILDAILSGALPASPMVVISNNSTAKALLRAEKEGIDAMHLSSATLPAPGELDRAILTALRMRDVNLVVLAGYMKKIGAEVLSAYRGRIVNIHPALLPKFGGQGMYGMKVHEAVIAAGEKVSGVTVHLVDEEYDRGAILAQAEVPLLPDETPESLQKRVLEQEHKLYPETLRRIATGEIDLDSL